MVNYVDYVTIENSFLDPQFSLGYDWDNYRVSFQVEIPNQNGCYAKREGGAMSSYQVRRYEGRYLNGHGYYNYGINYDNLTKFNSFWESRSENENQEALWSGGVVTYQGYNFSMKDIVARQGDKTRYKDYYGSQMNWGRLIIGDLNIEGPYNIGEIKVEVNDELVVDLKPCLNNEGVPYFYDEVRKIVIYPYGYGPGTTSMIKTVVMTGDRQQLPIYDGIDKSKIQNRIIEVNKYDDGYAACYDEISISADEDNLEGIEVSDYTIENQVNEAGVADFIELKPRGTLILPWNKQIAALNRPMVKGHRGDLLRIVVR